MAECSICLGTLQNPLVTPCGHSYCQDCLNRLPTVEQTRGIGNFIDRKISCPDCRNVFPLSAARLNVSLQRAIDQGSIGNVRDSQSQNPTAPRKSFSRGCARATLSEAYERELISIGATQALVDHLIVDEAKVALRIFLLDNSGSTAVEDGRLLVRSDDDKHRKGSKSRGSAEHGAKEFKYTTSSRWEEIKQLARDQARHNLGFGHVVEFHLLNPRAPGLEREGADYCRLDPATADAETLLDVLEHMLEGTAPGKGTPLAERLEFLRFRISSAMGTLGAFKEIFLCIVTDGVPTPMVWSNGMSQEQQLVHARERMVDELYRIVGSYPVSLVVRYGSSACLQCIGRACPLPCHGAAGALYAAVLAIGPIVTGAVCS
eukprot:m.188065 g.188065  ORF g.188065 m.188065 type:complete len:375 (-) comp18519_c0_seq6:1529-2653(-)